jgi:hypothetical protein
LIEVMQTAAKRAGMTLDADLLQLTSKQRTHGGAHG